MYELIFIAKNRVFLQCGSLACRSNRAFERGINRDVSKRSALDVYGLLPRKTWTGSQTSNSVFQTTGLEENTSSLRRVRQQFGIVRATLTTKLPKDLVLRTSLQLHGTSEEKMATEDYRSNLGDRGTRQENDVADYAGQLKTYPSPALHPSTKHLRPRPTKGAAAGKMW